MFPPASVVVDSTRCPYRVLEGGKDSRELHMRRPGRAPCTRGGGASRFAVCFDLLLALQLQGSQVVHERSEEQRAEHDNDAQEP